MGQKAHLAINPLHAEYYLDNKSNIPLPPNNQPQKAADPTTQPTTMDNNK